MADNLAEESEIKQQGPHRDEVFYADIIPVVFKVEDTLFRVRRDKFIHPGSFFETMFSLPQEGAPWKGPIEGQSDENPIVLEGIKAGAFRSLLRVMYPGFTDAMAPCETYEEWMNVLELSTMWDLPSIRTMAVSKLTADFSKIPIGEQIVLAQKYQVGSWLLSAYINIAIQKNPVPQRKLKEAGVDPLTIHKLTSARDFWLSEWMSGNWEAANKKFCLACHHPHIPCDHASWGPSSANSNSSFADMVRDLVVPNVRSIFNSELDGMKD